MTILGLDIGGANLKAALADYELAWCDRFARWHNTEELADRLSETVQRAESAEDTAVEMLAVTMSAEMCDCFATRCEGVEEILVAVRRAAGDRPVRVWTTQNQFAGIEQAMADPMRVASANWHALGTWVARLFPDGQSLLIDIGSTTTDLMSLCDGELAANGLTDTERLATSELLYLGARMTPVAALAQSMEWNGQISALMNETFATTGDVCLLAGLTNEDPTDRDTCDGRAMTRAAASGRLLRMVGGDLSTHDENDALRLAHQLIEILARRLVAGVTAVGGPSMPRRVIVSGSGAFLIEYAITSLLREVLVVRLADSLGAAASIVGPAKAVAQLASKWPSLRCQSQDCSITSVVGSESPFKEHQR